MKRPDTPGRSGWGPASPRRAHQTGNRTGYAPSSTPPSHSSRALSSLIRSPDLPCPDDQTDHRHDAHAREQAQQFHILSEVTHVPRTHPTQGDDEQEQVPAGGHRSRVGVEPIMTYRAVRWTYHSQGPWVSLAILGASGASDPSSNLGGPTLASSRHSPAAHHSIGGPPRSDCSGDTGRGGPESVWFTVKTPLVPLIVPHKHSFAF